MKAKLSVYSALFWVLALVIASAAAYTHFAAALTLPAPNNDEGLFLWQARAFQLTNGFRAPELDPNNPILILPLLYQAFVGVVFKVFGSSFELGRTISLVSTLVGFGLMALVARRHPTPFWGLALMGALLMNVHFVFMANQVRMEPLFFASIAGALLAMRMERDWLAISILCVLPMVHPNAMFYLAPVVILSVFSRDLLKQPLTRLEIGVFAFAAFVWIAHGIYVLKYWNVFMHDMAYRFGEMHSGTGRDAVEKFGREQVLTLLALIGLGALAWMRRVRAGPFIAIAVGAWIHGYARFEEAYFSFNDLFFWLLTMAALEIVAAGFDWTKIVVWLHTRVQLLSKFNVPETVVKTCALALVALLSVAFLHRTNRIEGPGHYLRDLNFAGMHVAAPGAFLSDESRQALRGYIRNYEPGRPIVVEVYPWSESFLLADFDDPRVRFQVPYLDPILRPPQQWLWGYTATVAATPDLYIIHDSAYTPDNLKFRTQMMIDRARSHPEVSSPEIIHQQEGTETWFALRTPRDAR